jgi:UDP-N-acetylmuramoylalanine--D-glutamate ligase
MALVDEIDSVRFYDDSKATNVSAAVTALLGLTEPHVVLIAGGRDKLGTYKPLAEVVRKKARGVVVIGEAQDRILAAIAGDVPSQRAQSIGEAVELAFEMARPGDAVLLSPACSSLDQFSSYKERGERFVEAVERLESPGKRGSS